MTVPTQPATRPTWPSRTLCRRMDRYSKTYNAVRRAYRRLASPGHPMLKSRCLVSAWRHSAEAAQEMMLVQMLRSTEALSAMPIAERLRALTHRELGLALRRSVWYRVQIGVCAHKVGEELQRRRMLKKAAWLAEHPPTPARRCLLSHMQEFVAAQPPEPAPALDRCKVCGVPGLEQCIVTVHDAGDPEACHAVDSLNLFQCPACGVVEVRGRKKPASMPGVGDGWYDVGEA